MAGDPIDASNVPSYTFKDLRTYFGLIAAFVVVGIIVVALAVVLVVLRCRKTADVEVCCVLHPMKEPS